VPETTLVRPGKRVNDLERTLSAAQQRVSELTLELEGQRDQNPLRHAIAALAQALLERDGYTSHHSVSVVRMAGQVSRDLALDERQVKRIETAALLHDIGKVSIPDEVLAKPGPLNSAEWALTREHPVIGERMLRAVPDFSPIARIVRHEHEHYDGSGYPDGLRGEDIPIGSRVILACDAYHAMISDRPYRKALSQEQAVAELADGAGTQFDPAVTEILIASLSSRRQMRAGTSAAA
jgi:putative nucleotidyltransferase with HDIG domain